MPDDKLEIKPKGRIHLGEEFELCQKLDPIKAEIFGFDTGRPVGMQPIQFTKQFTGSGELLKQRLSYSLKSLNQDAFITDSGLCTSYGIFGAPGSGKTFLVMYLLRQLLAFNKEKKDSKYGALILDPKAALIEDIQKIVTDIGREDDLKIINTELLTKENDGINVINADLDPYELGYQLILAAQSSGVATSDPYWILAWANLFGAATYLLKFGSEDVTISKLLEATISVDTTGEGNEVKIMKIAQVLRQSLENLDEQKRQDLINAIDEIENFYSQENKELATIKNIILRAYSPFRRSKYNCFSYQQSGDPSKKQISLYDEILEEGKIVLVSLSPAEIGFAKTLCTLMKCIFQRSVLSRLERVRSKRLENFKRPVLFACDEFSQVATELPGQPTGDGDFFSLSRQQGCMGILASQSVNVLQASSLKENWRSIFSNFGAKIFMRLVDNETIEEATKLAGESDWYVTSMGTSDLKMAWVPLPRKI